MGQKETSKRHHLIINYLRKRPHSFNEIKMHIETEFSISAYDLHFSKRTFQRDISDIASLYNIEIKYSKSLNKYQIVYDEKDILIEHILEAYDIANALNVENNFSQYIDFEQRVNSGTRFLLDCLTAIKNKKIVTLTYKRYTNETILERLLAPYALKEYQYKWYLVANDCEDKKIKLFGLDRIVSFTTGNKTFTYPQNFKVSEFFKHRYGVMFSDENPVEIELSFNTFRGNYIKRQPLHPSQKILIDNDNELRISLFLIPTLDFKLDLLKYAGNISIIKPLFFKNDIRKLHSMALKKL